MIIFSASSKVIPNGIAMLFSCELFATAGGRSSIFISSPELITTALSTQLRSSLMFPGQSYFIIAAFAFPENPFTAFPFSLLNSSKNAEIKSGRSLFRSRSGGT